MATGNPSKSGKKNKGAVASKSKYGGLLSSDDGDNFRCDICKMNFSDYQEYESHIASKKHHMMHSRYNKEPEALKIGTSKVENSTSDSEDDEVVSTSYDCDICSKSFNKFQDYQIHANSRLHNKNLKKKKAEKQIKDTFEDLNIDGEGENEDDDIEVSQKPFAECKRCGKVFSGPEQFKLHLDSAAHEKAGKNIKLLKRMKAKHSNDDNGEKDVDEIIKKCDTCNKCFSGPVPYQVHMESPAHQKQLKNRQIAEEIKFSCVQEMDETKYVCKECNKQFPHPLSFKNHQISNNHAKLKTKKKLFDFISKYPEIVPFRIDMSIDETASAPTEEENDQSENNHFLKCTICKVAFSGPESARDHVLSKKHIAAKEEASRAKGHKQKNSATGHDTSTESGESSRSLGMGNNASSRDVEDEDPETETQQSADLHEQFEII